MGDENLVIIKNMVEHVSREIINLNISAKNENLIDPIKVATLINKMIFGQDYVSEKYFYGKTLDDAKAIISEIFKMSIDLRVEALGTEQASKILKDIIIQNLDFN
jgi:preprotein translocase subunit SecA